MSLGMRKYAYVLSRQQLGENVKTLSLAQRQGWTQRGNSKSGRGHLSKFSVQSCFNHNDYLKSRSSPRGRGPALNLSAAPPVHVSLSNILNPLTRHPYQRMNREFLHWEVLML